MGQGKEGEGRHDQRRWPVGRKKTSLAQRYHHYSYMATPSDNQLSREELAEFREIFNLVDRDGGGSISKEELGELMDTLGINASQEEVDLMIEEIDQDNNGEIDFDEFVAVMSRKVNANYTPAQVKNAFKIFESTATPPGYIKVEELKAALCQYSKDKPV